MSQASSDAANDEPNSVHWEFSPDQQQARDALSSGDYALVNFRGGFGSGKSILGSSEAIETAKEIPNGRTLITSQDREKGKTTTFEVFFERLPGENCNPFAGGDPENSRLVESWSKGDWQLEFTNGHTITFGSGANWRATAGGKYNFIWADEVAHYKTNLDKLTEMLLFRLRTEEGPNVMLWTTTGDGYNDYWRLIVKRELTNGDPFKAPLTDIVAFTKDNPFLPNKKRLIETYKGTAREEEALRGGFAASENRVYRQYGEMTHLFPSAMIDGRHWVWRYLFPYYQPAAYRQKNSRYGYAFSPKGGNVCIEIRQLTTGQIAVASEFVDNDDTTHISDVCDWLGEKSSGAIYTVPATSEYDIDVLASSTDNPVYETGEDTERATPLVCREFELDNRGGGIGGNAENPDDGTPRLIVTDECERTNRALLSHTTDDTDSKKKRSTHTLCCEALRAAVHQTPVPDDEETA